MSSARRPPPPRVLHLAAIFPTTGVDGPLGLAMQRGVEVAVLQHVRLSPRYRLALTRMDEAGVSPVRMETVLRNRQVLGVVGLLESASARTLLPAIERQRIPAISPLSLLPRLPASRNGSAGKHPTIFFPLSATSEVAGTVAADVAVAPAPAPAAQAVFLVDDGSLSGQRVADAFAAELVRRRGVISGRRSATPRNPTNMQRAVSAIIEANPDLVFYAGGTVAGADLRRTLSGTGAPLLRILTVGFIADHPGWAAAVGARAVSAHTIGILPAPDLSALPGAKRFLSGYHRAFPGRLPLPQSAMGYNFALDEIAAIKALIRAGKPVAAGALDAILARSWYRGIAGPLAVTRAGSPPLPRFSLYTCDLNGVWHYRGAVK